MNTTASKIDKSKLMKRAWTIYRSNINTRTWTYDLSFSESLKRAWELEKADAAWKADREAGKKIEVSTVPYYASASNYYNNAVSGAYFGD